MKFSYAINVVLGVAMALSIAQGARAEDLRIGVINTGKVMEQAPQAEAATKRLTQEFEPRQSKLIKLKDELSQKQQQGEKDSLTMSETARKDLEKEIGRLARDLKVGEDEFREDLRARKAEELGKVQNQILAVIQTMAKEEKYDLILNDNAVIYVSDKVDITDGLLARLKKAHE